MRSPKIRLFLLSFLMLFVELALIRWTGANVVYLSYFSNFVLLGSFLGIGVGFLRANSKTDLSPWAPVALTALVLFVWRLPVQIDRSDRDLLFFGGEPSGLPIWLMLPLVFIAVATVMMTIGEGVARVFGQFEPLEAYRIDILGSLAGIAAFSALSFARSPSVGWGAVATALFVLVSRPRTLAGALRLSPLLLLLAALTAESLSPNVSWSPYYKVTTVAPGDGSLTVFVNGIPHQAATTMLDRIKREPIYAQPYDVATHPPREVLVIGAGTGNDVALALRQPTVVHVDAVEIDPRIYQLGSEVHPEHPYSDPRVEVHIDDGRAFLESSTKKYDLILLALPDSLTLVAGQSSLRLESYLFTREAFEAARDHLAPGGEFTMYNFYREMWLRDRYARTLTDVYGHPPCVATFEATAAVAALTIALTPDGVRCQQVWTPGDAPAPASDDHPFPYLHDASIPGFYLLTMALVLLASLVVIRLASGTLRPMGRYVDLFCMGAAFLLLETKSVVQFALLFGTTWFVNALVFAGILASVYLAVELAMRTRLHRPEVLYAALLASLVVAWAVPLDALLGLNRPLRFAAAVALSFTPVMLANLIFAQRFRDVGSSTTAFGANLLGAMFGGVLEYGALIVGYRALLAAVAVLYGAAFFIGRATWMRNAPTRVNTRQQQSLLR